jgi:branched-chain amino acid transport system substrate-binding protein
MSIGRDLIIPQTSVDETTVTKNTSDFLDAEIAHFKSANATSYTYEPISWVWTGNSVFASAIRGMAIAAKQAAIDSDDEIKAILAKAGKTWKIKVMANNWGIGETTPTICGPTCNGDFFYGLFPVPRFADLTNATAMAQLIATRDAWAQADQTAIPPAPITPRKYDDYRDVRYVQGYAAAVMWEEAVKKAVDAGSKNPTGVEIKNALEQFKAQDLGGLTAGPITFSPTDHRPQSNEVIYKVDASGNLAFVDRFSITLTAEWLGY